MWQIVRGKRLGGHKFRRQHVIGEHIVDFVCLSARLVVEVDGDTHGSDLAEIRDTPRARRIEEAGFRIVRFWSDDVLNATDGVVERLSASLNPRPSP